MLMNERKNRYKTSPDNSHEVINLSIRFEDTVNPEENYTIVNNTVNEAHAITNTNA